MNQTQMNEKAEYVHSVFESIANDYDKMNNVISFGSHIAWRNYTMKQMNIQPGHTALDVACGTADWTIALAKAVGKEGSVVGLDFSQNMLDVGAYKVANAGVGNNVKLVNADAMNLPYEDHTFDFVTIGFALRNVPDVQQVLNEMARVVKPGGKVVSLEVSKPPFIPYRKLFYLYFYKILPFIAKLTVNKYEEYAWLPQSLTNFPDSRELASMFQKAGLDPVQVKLFMGGVSALHIGTKP
ncbi:demethylmenaquinone methyltransferase [Brevibacillus sp. HB1.2]|uniref:Demethylmenaquinone methyltransferase n=2 Tax=Brevibacillus TaxID=55080 RepID=A0A837KS23_9BACL|nr:MULTISPECIES: demethylmenaquinone methyltransferase [Brevibacillus]ATF13012.1 bifunctional demethylmenaquinone methyltransferase/2-methoxy-6-polyprenyl-1,4-benzoquinol methylase UbiE [Brevibacillus brevis X23]NTU19283.1 demethylmenaquinone methyltransferase [Brevibacillus sp. HB1.2]NTU30090.1 demethylmenaquinone methyltransferase [Brevibacillus sp. HB1.1]KLH99842.1 ubiquinone biosynthesis methyltransferase UbiE [Brevibacillus formosus]MBG9946097.1 ubiquinone biosynthesis methyltransferase U